MHRLFITSSAIDGNEITIEGSDVHHMRDVIRLSPGDSITCVDEGANEHEARIDSFGDDRIKATITATTRQAIPQIYLALFQGLPKGSKFDSVIEKGTELGADKIAPVIMERSVSRPKEKQAAKVERWRRKAEAAAKQCQRPTIPEISSPLSWAELLSALGEFDLTILFWETATERLEDALEGFSGKKLAIVIGPEGGISSSEASQLIEQAAKQATLGPRILRTETAPLAALAIVNHILER